MPSTNNLEAKGIINYGDATTVGCSVDLMALSKEWPTLDNHEKAHLAKVLLTRFAGMNMGQYAPECQVIGAIIDDLLRN